MCLCGDRRWLNEMGVIYFDGGTKQQENRIVILVSINGKWATKQRKNKDELERESNPIPNSGAHIALNGICTNARSTFYILQNRCMYVYTYVRERIVRFYISSRFSSLVLDIVCTARLSDAFS